VVFYRVSKLREVLGKKSSPSCFQSLQSLVCEFFTLIESFSVHFQRDSNFQSTVVHRTIITYACFRRGQVTTACFCVRCASMAADEMPDESLTNLRRILTYFCHRGNKYEYTVHGLYCSVLCGTVPVQ
jgi:hypothetical protein